MYIPDLTERYPEGFDGPDMYEPRDIEYMMWKALEREYYESEEKVSQAVKTGLFAKQLECATCELWRDTETESGCAAPFSCNVIG